MAVNFFKEIGVGKSPSRLFVGGLHGKEGLSTISAIENVKDINPNKGRLVLANFPPSPYLSTLDPLYYMSLAGGKLLNIIKKYQPEIYLELHCYHPDKKERLTGQNRKAIFGVPGLVEIENGVLIGSTSPLIRSVFFQLHDFPFIMEIPWDPNERSLGIAKKIMEIAAKSNNRSQIMNKIKKDYPKQVELLNHYFNEFSHNFWPAFQEVKKQAQKIDLNNYEDLDEFVNKVIKEGGYDLNSKQINQLGQSYLIFKEYG